MKNISFPIFNVLASVIGIASIIIFLFIWQASSIIFNLEGVQKEIESRITKEFPGAKVSIKKINLSLGSIATVVGDCENCEEDTVLVAVVTDYYRCTTCGADTRQHINGRIRYMQLSEDDKQWLKRNHSSE